jgi:glycerate dehydrogenase
LRLRHKRWYTKERKKLEERQMKIVILDGYTTNPGDLSWAPLEAQGDVTAYEGTKPEELVERAREADAVILNKVRMGAVEFDALPKLKYIGMLATGYDVIDIAEAGRHGIVVANVPGYASRSVAQLTFALLLELCMQPALHSQHIKDEHLWCKQRYATFWLTPLTELSGKTLGIVGLGQIGREVAKVGRAFGMRIVARGMAEQSDEEVKRMSLEELMKVSDVVSMHCPLFPETKGIIHKGLLKLMKPTAFFINTSRGALVVEQDLADALNRGAIAGAGLDVLAIEPAAEDNPLLNAKNTIITPHIGWATVEARQALIEQVAKNLAAFQDGRPINSVSRI